MNVRLANKVLLSVAAFYLVVTIPLGRLQAFVEKRVAVLR